MSTRIVFNGQEYPSLEAMPADVRTAYEEVLTRLREDKNQNGIPDVFEGQGAIDRGGAAPFGNDFATGPAFGTFGRARRV